MVFPKPQELAILTVNGAKYEDWESVTVRHDMRSQPPYLCRFTCSEGMPLAKNFAKLQIMPGMDCTVTLAGYPAFSGKVETRQVYYDSNRHHIEIQCATFTELATSSVISKTMQWKEKTFQQIGQEVLGKLGIKMVFEGGAPPSYKFPKISATPGESIHDFLDTLSRSLSSNTGLGISFTTNIDGDFVVAMGSLPGTDYVVEGKNIIIGREIIYRPSSSEFQPAIGQGPGTNETWGPQAALKFFGQGSGIDGADGGDGLGSSFGTAPAVIRSEMATWDKTMLKGRVTSESMWQTADVITVFATVYGWTKASGGLWERNKTVFVTSPMLVMQDEALTAKSVTFTQDNSTGTRTTLELCNPAGLAGTTAPAVNNS